MAVRASGWEITGAPGWPCINDDPNDGTIGAITLKPQTGDKADRRMREAEAVVSATFGYIGKTEATLQQSTRFWQRPWEWLTGGLLLSAYTSLHAAEANRILLLGSEQLAALLPAIRQRAVKYLPADDPTVAALNGLPDPTAPAHQALERVQSKLVETVAAAHVATMTQGKAAAAQAAQTPGSPNGATAPDTSLVRLTGILGRDQHIASRAMGEANSVLTKAGGDATGTAGA